MKRSYIYPFFIVLLAFVSGCSKQDHGDDFLPDNLSEEVYLRLNIVQQESSTRTMGDVTETGTEAESKISNLHVYLVKPDFSEVRKLAGLGTWHQTSEGYASDPIQVRKGDYWLYLIANATHADHSAFTPTLSSVGAFMGEYALDGKEQMDRFVADGYFVMSNEQNYVEAAGDYTRGGVAVSIGDLNTKDNPAMATVKLDRLAAKIVPEVSDTFVSAIDGMELISEADRYYIDRTEVEGTALLNCVKRFNLIQQWKEGPGYVSFPIDMELETPSRAPGYPSVAYYNRLAEYVDPVTMTVDPSAVFAGPGTPLFCMENNSFEYSPSVIETKYKSRTTAVLFKVKVRTFKDDGTVAVELPGHTFYRYNTLCFASLDDLKGNNPELTPLNSVSELRLAGVQVYEEGYMYYIHWIKDTNYTRGGEHYYAVMRNTWYGLTVNEVSGLGGDIPRYEPEEPIDREMADILVYPVCEDWTYRTVEHTFE